LDDQYQSIGDHMPSLLRYWEAHQVVILFLFLGFSSVSFVAANRADEERALARLAQSALIALRWPYLSTVLTRAGPSSIQFLDKYGKLINLTTKKLVIYKHANWITPQYS
jgi:hypothetical protein